jgi:hypothetical protein
MALYELRTYTLRVGAMAEAVKLYQELGFPALQKGGQDKKLVGYFQSDTGTINQLVHLWKFDDDADRRAHWAAVYANKDFVEGFASKFRPLLMTQEVKLLHAAPWGPPLAISADLLPAKRRSNVFRRSVIHEGPRLRALHMGHFDRVDLKTSSPD